MPLHPQPPAVQGTPDGDLLLSGLFLETDGLGGYACAPVSGIRTSPAHGMVVVAKDPPGKRHVLLNGFDVEVHTGSEPVCLSHRPSPDPEPAWKNRLLQMDLRPWPVWRYDLGDGKQMEFECLARHGSHQFVFSWHLTHSEAPVRLQIRPLLSGRPLDAPRSADSRLDLRPRMPSSRQFVWSLPTGAPNLALLTDGIYHPDPKWITGFRLNAQAPEDLASPCSFVWELQPRERAHIVASAGDDLPEDPHTCDYVAQYADKIRKAERTRRRLFRSEMDRAADQYVVSGRTGSTVLSGYPGGGETGEAAMISIRGIALSPGRLDVAGEILATWRNRMAAGLIPDVISEYRRTPVFSSAAPSLWYVVAAYEYIRTSYRHGRILSREERQAIEDSVEEILQSLIEQRHRHIFLDQDGLVAEADHAPSGISTGRIRKRAHIQALWIAALRIGDRLHRKWAAPYAAARSELERSFWNTRRGCLCQAIVTSPRGSVERVETLDLDQILAVGGLPIVCVSEDKASLIVQAMERRLHGAGESQQPSPQLPWQSGPFIEAWFRVHHRTPGIQQIVLNQFIIPWQRRLRCGLRAARPNSLGEVLPPPDSGNIPSFAALETMELLRILHLPELVTRADPFDDKLNEPLFYD